MPLATKIKSVIVCISRGPCSVSRIQKSIPEYPKVSIIVPEGTIQNGPTTTSPFFILFLIETLFDIYYLIDFHYSKQFKYNVLM